MSLSGKRVAILVEQDFQDLEVLYPMLRLREEQCEVRLIGANNTTNLKGKYGYPIAVDSDITDVEAKNFHAVIIPGGWAPDFLRRSKHMIKFVRDMNDQGKVIASICHGGWLLASADLLKGKKATSFFAIKDDMKNAGSDWVDEQYVVDGNLITARNPDDLPVFVAAIIKALED